MAGEKTITRIRKNGQDYFPSSSQMDSQISAAQDAAVSANQAVVAATEVVRATQEVVGGYLIPHFDTGVSYREYDLVFYQNHVWRCKADRAAGAWDDNGWVQTSLYNEIVDMRGADRYETVQIQLRVNRGSGVVAGQKVYVSFANGDPTVEYTADSDGVVEFSLLHDTVYTVEAQALSGYGQPRAVTHTANMNLRHITLTYKQLASGIYVIDENGNETDIALWDVANNYKAKLIKYTDSDLAANSNSFAIAVHHSIYQNQKWCIENVQFVSIPNIGSADNAKLDLNGVDNTDKILQEAVGKVYDYNQAHSSSLTVADYVQAAAKARAESIVIGGETYYGFLPSAGQIWKYRQNISDMNAAMIECGGTGIGITGGDWWSSSQLSQNHAWFLSSGSLDNTSSKNNGSQVLPFFDF